MNVLLWNIATDPPTDYARPPEWTENIKAAYTAFHALADLDIMVLYFAIGGGPDSDTDTIIYSQLFKESGWRSYFYRTYHWQYGVVVLSKERLARVEWWKFLDTGLVDYDPFANPKDTRDGFAFRFPTLDIYFFDDQIERATDAREHIVNQMLYTTDVQKPFLLLGNLVDNEMKGIRPYAWYSDSFFLLLEGKKTYPANSPEHLSSFVSANGFKTATAEVLPAAPGNFTHRPILIEVEKWS